MKRQALAICIGLLVFVPHAQAQTSAGGSLRGYVKDEQGGVLPGVTLMAASPSAGGSRTAITDADGSYRLLELPPGDYTITAELQGFAKLVRPNIVVRAGLNLALDLTMKVGALIETVTVKAETPLLESRSAANGINITGDLQRSLPLSKRRDWADFMFVTPGVISNDSPDNTTFSHHGAFYNSNVVQVDGADMASSTSNSQSYLRMSTEVISDVSVKTGAVDASAPLGLGAVINVATASGANQLAGSAGFAYQAKKWNGNNTPGGTSTTVGLFQPDLALGGPILKDRVWYLGVYRRTRRIVGLARTSSQLATLKTLVPDFQAFDNETRANNYFGKLTSQLSTGHQLSGFGQRDVTPREINTGTYAGKFRRSEQGGSAFLVRLSSTWGSNMTTRLAVSYNDKAIPFFTTYSDRPGRNVYGATVRVGNTLSGAGLLAVLDNYAGNGVSETARKTTISGDLTYFHRGAIGSHELQAGLYVQPWNRQRTALTWSNNGFAVEDNVLRSAGNPSAGVVPFHRRVYDTTVVPSNYVDTVDNAFYAQDSWRPTDRLTISAGVRVDVVKQRDVVFNVPTMDSTNLGPRFGFNYAMTADGRNSVRGSWTRVHETPTRTATGAGSTTGGFTDSYDLNFDGVFETSFVTPGSSALNPAKVFDLNNWHLPFADDVSLGYRRQLPQQTIVDISWTRREFRDRPAGVEINGIYDRGVFQGYKNVAANEVYLVANNVWNWPVYSALDLQISRQTSDLQLIASYTRQWRHLAGTWQPNDPAMFIQPDAFPNNKGIGGTTGFAGSSLDANSLSGTQGNIGVEEWHDHSLHAAASYNFPAGFLIATTYIFQSGPWSGPVVTRLAAPDPSFGPSTVTLSNGRVVQNPLATPIRFVGPTRSDGQFTLTNVHILNLRVGRHFALGRHRLEAAIDGFNITNHDADQYWFSGANQLYNPLYKTGFSRQLPRSMQLSLRWSF